MVGQRKRPIQREHICQKHVRLWAREALAVDHIFMGFDRGKPSGQWTHAREKMRGIERGTPDTLLKIKSRMPIWAECKAPGNEPDQDQRAMGARLMALGDEWFWFTSVNEYRSFLVVLEVPMHRSATFLAILHDGSVATEIAKAELKAGTVPKAMKTRRYPASPGRIAAEGKVRSRTMF